MKARIADRNEVEFRRMEVKRDKAENLCEWPVMQTLGGRRKKTRLDRAESSQSMTAEQGLTYAEREAAHVARKQRAKREEMERRRRRIIATAEAGTVSDILPTTTATTSSSDRVLSPRKDIAQKLAEEQAWRDMRKRSKERRGAVPVATDDQAPPAYPMETRAQGRAPLTTENVRTEDEAGTGEDSDSDSDGDSDSGDDGDDDEYELRVLMADDNVINTKLMKHILEKLGYGHVRMVVNGLEAIQALEEETFDIILMDIMMPQMDGYHHRALFRGLSVPCACE
jgi:CheY-like chemotaxis protein